MNLSDVDAMGAAPDAENAYWRGLAFDRTTCVNDDPAVIDALAARAHQLASR